MRLLSEVAFPKHLGSVDTDLGFRISVTRVMDWEAPRE